jgi:anti-anti-sigma regulatory factor
LIELWGEFDVFCLDELKRALTDVSPRRGAVMVDLSGISFLDLQSARELAVRSLLYAHYLTFLDPSPQVMATVRALGLEGWLNIRAGTGRDESRVVSGVL